MLECTSESQYIGQKEASLLFTACCIGFEVSTLSFSYILETVYTISSALKPKKE
jgi:hypothetical protein